MRHDELITLNNGHLLVKLPEGAYEPRISMSNKLYYNITEAGYVGDHIIKCVEEEATYHIDLPPGDYDIKRFEEMTEGVWKDIVESTKLIPVASTNAYIVYRDFEKGGWLNTATESGLSLIRSHNVNPSETIIALKKQ